MVKWRFHEPISGDSYVFEIGPSEGSGGTYQRQGRYQSRAALDGSTVLDVVRAEARTEDYTGTLLSSNQYYALADWSNRGLIIQVTDDLSRQFDAVIMSFEPTRERNFDYPWKHKFSLRFLFLEANPPVVPDPIPVVASYGPSASPTRMFVQNNDTDQEEGYSTDLGVSWTLTPSIDVGHFDAYFFYWNGSQWWAGGFPYAGGTGNILWNSPDGLTWTGRLSGIGFAPGRDSAYQMVYTGSLYVIVGIFYIDSSNTRGVKTSADGITWTVRTSSLDGFLQGLAYNGSRFVAGGADSSGSVLQTSDDGSTWTTRSTPMDKGVADVATVYTVCWSEELTLFVAGGYRLQSGYVGPSIMTSPNGITWSAAPNIFDAGYCVDINWNGEMFVAVGQVAGVAAVATSTNGTSWTRRSTPFDVHSGNYSFVRWDGTQWWIVGQVSSATIPPAFVALKSPNGITWNDVEVGFTDANQFTYGVGIRPNYAYGVPRHE